MRWKRLGKALLWPHTVLLFLLVPLSALLLAVAFLRLSPTSPACYVIYALAAYTLTVLCARIPAMIAFFRTVKRDNRYIRHYFEDERQRVRVSLYASLAFNVIYAVLQLWLGLYHGSFWFYSMAMYYVTLALMRFFLVRYLHRERAGKRLCEELRRYRLCGVIFLVMNLALSLMVFFMVYWDRTFHHHEITTIMLAAYTFTSFTLAVISIVKYRKYQSPVYTATKTISLAAACVSMLTLETTMLTTFGGETTDALMRKTLLGISGGVICALIIAMALYMIVSSTQQLKGRNKKE